MRIFLLAELVDMSREIIDLVRTHKMFAYARNGWSQVPYNQAVPQDLYNYDRGHQIDNI